MKKSIRREGSRKHGTIRLPVRTAPRASIIDCAALIPVIAAKTKASSKLVVIRRADLLPRRFQALVTPGGWSYGFQLLDVFSPTYGFDYPFEEPHFRFEHSALARTTDSAWIMALDELNPTDQELSFRVLPDGQGNYLKILLGQSQSPSGHCLLDVRVNGVKFTADVYGLGFQYFDVVLADPGVGAYDVQFSLRRASNVADVQCILRQLELYRSIRTFPSDHFSQ